MTLSTSSCHTEEKKGWNEAESQQTSNWNIRECIFNNIFRDLTEICYMIKTAINISRNYCIRQLKKVKRSKSLTIIQNIKNTNIEL